MKIVEIKLVKSNADIKIIATDANGVQHRFTTNVEEIMNYREPFIEPRNIIMPIVVKKIIDFNIIKASSPEAVDVAKVISDVNSAFKVSP